MKKAMKIIGFCVGTIAILALGGLGGYEWHGPSFLKESTTELHICWRLPHEIRGGHRSHGYFIAVQAM